MRSLKLRVLVRAGARAAATFSVVAAGGCEVGERPGTEATEAVVKDAASALHMERTPGEALQMGLAALHGGQLEAALGYLERATLGDSTNASAFDALGTAYGAAGRSADALGAAERAVRLEPGNAAFRSNRAQAYRRFGRSDEALADLDRAVEIDPDLTAALFNRGALRYERRDYEGALADFTRAIEADSLAGPPRFNRAVTLEALGRLDEARADMERFIGLTVDESSRTIARQLLERWSGAGS